MDSQTSHPWWISSLSWRVTSRSVTYIEGQSPSMPKACLPLINPRKFNGSHDPYDSHTNRNSKCFWNSKPCRTSSYSQSSEEPEKPPICWSGPSFTPEVTIQAPKKGRKDRDDALSRLSHCLPSMDAERQLVRGVKKLQQLAAETRWKECELQDQIHPKPPDPFLSPHGTTHTCDTMVDSKWSPLPYTYLPPMKPEDVVRGMKTLVLDLNGILIHTSLEPSEPCDFKIPVWVNWRLCEMYVVKRPGVEQFLATVARMYEVVVFTASPPQYTDLILDVLDKKAKWIRYRLYEDACTSTEAGWLKDLSVLGRDLTKVITVGSKASSHRLQPANSLQVGKFAGDKTDRELDDLLRELQLVWRLNV